MNENFYGATHPGKVRTNNEDVFIAIPLPGGMVAAAAIDGVGGYEGGEIAAATAKAAITEILQQPFQHKEDTLRECLYLANKRIFEERPRHEQAMDMACVVTLALADIANNEFHYAHVGDTRLYLLRAHNLMKQTRDQSFVGFLEDTGRIGEEEAMMHPKRNEINKALGFDAYIHQKSDYIETGSSPFLPGDLLLLCSDGLTDMVGSRQILEILSSDGTLKQKTEGLIQAANDAGGKDNITVVLVLNDRRRTNHEATRPVERAVPEARMSEPAKVHTDNVAESSGPMPKDEHTPVTPPMSYTASKPTGGYRTATIILVFVCCGLLAAIGLILFGKKKPEQLPTQAAAIQPDAKQQALQAAINGGGDTLVLDAASYGSLIHTTEALQVSRDSIYIQANGLTLSPDSSYNGPALVLGAGCKHIRIDNLVFDGFDTAITANGNSVYLGGSRFMNCKVPIRYNFLFPSDGGINALINDSIYARADSVSNIRSVR